MVITPPPFLEGPYECHVIRGEYTSYVNNFISQTEGMIITFFLYKNPPTNIRQRKLPYKLYMWNLFSNFVMLVHPLMGGQRVRVFTRRG